MLQVGLEPIPGYRLTQHLGTGGFGEVWEAQTPGNGRAALKFLDVRSRPAELIRNEIQILRGLAQLKHPYIIELRGVHATSRFLILHMERADGNLEDLRETYQEAIGRNIPGDHALELLGQVAEALDFLAHVQLPGFNSATRGLQHCDIKPTNLLLVGDQVKVADFGLCAGTNWKTQRNGWKGTLPYAAPELFRGQSAPGTDQYALAVTYLRLVAGDRVFFKSERLTGGPPTLPVDLRRVREREVAVITRALHPQPSARWPSCQAFIDALSRALTAPRPTPPAARIPRIALQPTRA